MRACSFTHRHFFVLVADDGVVCPSPTRSTWYIFRFACFCTDFTFPHCCCPSQQSSTGRIIFPFCFGFFSVFLYWISFCRVRFFTESCYGCRRRCRLSFYFWGEGKRAPFNLMSDEYQECKSNFRSISLSSLLGVTKKRIQSQCRSRLSGIPL